MKAIDNARETLTRIISANESDDLRREQQFVLLQVIGDKLGGSALSLDEVDELQMLLAILIELASNTALRQKRETQLCELTRLLNEVAKG
jgi:hypothetical protein